MSYRVLLVALLVGSSAQSGTVTHVDFTNCPGSVNGSELNPYCSIQTAIGNAVDTDEIVVASGTYFETIDFLGNAIALRCSDSAAVTTIDAQGTGSAVICWSQPGDGSIPIGVNLNWLTYYGSSWTFVDMMKCADKWGTLSVEMPWGPDTELIDQIPVDPDGYPLEIPYSVPGEGEQVVRTLMAMGMDGHYPAGHYNCFYEGQGVLVFGADVSNVTLIEPGWYELDVTLTNAGIYLNIMQSQAGDHVRNIRVIMPGFEDNYAEQVFHPLFMERLEPFEVIRFMDWQRINGTTVSSWQDRTLVTDQRQATERGVAPEYIIELSNRLSVDPWICIPHLADDNYIQNLAAMFRDNLNPDLKIYLEYSNETWNSGFPQWAWVEKNGPPDLNHPQKSAFFSKSVFDIWMSEFAGQETRLVRVLAAQNGNPWTIQQQLDWIFDGRGGCDAAAGAPYFNLTLDQYSQLDEFTPPSVFAAFLHEAIDTGSDSLTANYAHAQTHGVPFIAYEGGQALAPPAGGTQPPWLPAMLDFQRSPEIYGVYRHFFATWREINPGALFVAYSYCGPWKTGQWGAWSHLEYQDEPLEATPKMRALIDATCGCPLDINGDGMVATADFIELLGAWGTNAGHPADFNGDGFVDISDLLVLLGGWGPCPSLSTPYPIAE